MKRFVFRLLAIALPLLALLACSEMVVRRFALAPVIQPMHHNLYRLCANPRLEYELAPYRVDDNVTVTNARGRRDFNYPPGKAPNVFRIAVLGDSVAFGMNVRLHEPFAKILEQYLNRYAASPAARFEVFNYGVCGYNLIQTTATYLDKALADDPDLVVLSYNLNDPEPDFVDMKSLKEMTDSLGAASSVLRGLLPRWQSYQFAKHRWLCYRNARSAAGHNSTWSNFDPRRYAAKWKDVAPEHRYVFEITDAGWPLVQDSLARLKAQTDANHDRVVLVVLPMAFPELRPYPYLPVNHRIVEEARRQGYDAIDLLPGYEQAYARWPDRTLRSTPDDYSHPNALGHRVQAWTLAVHLIRSGLLPLPEEAFSPQLFDFETVGLDPPVAWFGEADMLYAELAFRLLRQGQYAGAVQALEILRRLNPENPLRGAAGEQLLRRPIPPDLRQRAVAALKP